MNAQDKAATRTTAFACFGCRVSVKRDDHHRPTAVCGRCGGTLHQMGWSFHAPPASDVEQWTKVQVLFAEGFRFISSGCSDSEPLPERLRDVAGFLKRHPKHRLRVAERQIDLLP